MISAHDAIKLPRIQQANREDPVPDQKTAALTEHPIFLTCAQADEARAILVEKRLRESGFSVFRLGSLGAGQNRDALIVEALAQSPIVLALWSREAQGSPRTLQHAIAALQSGRLVQASFDHAGPPALLFDLAPSEPIHNLGDWSGYSDDPAWGGLVDYLSRRLERARARPSQIDPDAWQRDAVALSARPGPSAGPLAAAPDVAPASSTGSRGSAPSQSVAEWQRLRGLVAQNAGKLGHGGHAAWRTTRIWYERAANWSDRAKSWAHQSWRDRQRSASTSGASAWQKPLWAIKSWQDLRWPAILGFGALGLILILVGRFYPISSKVHDRTTEAPTRTRQTGTGASPVDNSRPLDAATASLPLPVIAPDAILTPFPASAVRAIETSRLAQQRAELVANEAEAIVEGAKTAAQIARDPASQARQAETQTIELNEAARQNPWFGPEEEGISDGLGERDFRDGTIFYGTEKRNLKEGVGIMQFKNGDRFAGMFRDDQPNGYGVYRFADGVIYAGQWARGGMRGHGVLTWPDGARFEGEFGGVGSDPTYDGFGGFWAPGAAAPFIALWRDGELVEALQPER